MKKLNAGILGLLFIATVSLSEAKGQEQPAWSLPTEKTDYGSFPDNYEATIKAWYAERLKDPYSAVYTRISIPRKEHMIVNVDQHLAAYGYSVCATVNAKNSYGAYGGNQSTWFMIRDGKIIRTIDMQHPLFGKIISRGHAINCDDGAIPLSAKEKS